MSKISTVAVIGWGRMNPPTIGHLKMIRKMKELADLYKGNALLYLSHTVDKKNEFKNPLPYADKIQYAEHAFGKYVTVVESDAKTVMNVLHEVYDNGYEDVIYVGGEDRIGGDEDITAQISKYNGYEVTNPSLYYKFNSIKFVSAGHRDDASSNLEEKASASYARQLVKDDDQSTFIKMSPLSEEEATDLFSQLKDIYQSESKGSLKEALILPSELYKHSYFQDILDDIKNADELKLGVNGETSVDLNEVRDALGDDLDAAIEQMQTAYDADEPYENIVKMFNTAFKPFFSWGKIFKGKYSGHDTKKLSTKKQESLQAVMIAIKMLGLDVSSKDPRIFDKDSDLYDGHIAGVKPVLDDISLNEYKEQMTDISRILDADLPDDLKGLDNFTIVHPDGIDNLMLNDKALVKKMFGDGFSFYKIMDSGSTLSIPKDVFAPADLYVVNLDYVSDIKAEFDALPKKCDSDMFVDVTNQLFAAEDGVHKLIPISLKMSSRPSWYKIINTDPSTLSYFSFNDITDIYFNPTGNSVMTVDAKDGKELTLEFRLKGEKAKEWQCNANIKGNTRALAGGSAKTYMKLAFESDMAGKIASSDIDMIRGFFGDKVRGSIECALGKEVKAAKSDSSQAGNIGLGIFCKQLIDHQMSLKHGEEEYDHCFTYVVQHSFKKAADVQNTLKIM